MARVGSFDQDLSNLAWFDETGVVEGWFDDDLIGAAASGAYTLNADSGSYAISGTAATLLHNRVLQADSGAYLLVGTDATFVYTPNADQQATGGGEYLRHKLIRQFEDDQRRVEALSKLPAIKPAERLAVKRAAHKLATSVEPFTFDDVAAEINASLRETDTKGQESHLDWVLYFLRVEAYNLEKQAQEAEELEIVAAMMMARKQWQL